MPLAQLQDPALLKTDAFINGQWRSGEGRWQKDLAGIAASINDLAARTRDAKVDPLMRSKRVVRNLNR